MTDTFNFAPNGIVPTTLPPEPMQGVTMNGWTFTSRPSVPYQRKFKVVLNGMRWFTTDPGADNFVPNYKALSLTGWAQSGGPTWTIEASVPGYPLGYALFRAGTIATGTNAYLMTPIVSIPSGTLPLFLSFYLNGGGSYDANRVFAIFFQPRNAAGATIGSAIGITSVTNPPVADPAYPNFYLVSGYVTPPEGTTQGEFFLRYTNNSGSTVGSAYFSAPRAWPVAALNTSYAQFDYWSQPAINARALEKFYEDHGVWAPFYWTHPHFGPLTVRFAAPLNVPEGIPNSGGQIDKVELTLIHHDPSFT